MNNKNCENCNFIGYDSNLLGYCNRRDCVHYRNIIIDDRGCLVDNCTYFDSIKNFKISNDIDDWEDKPWKQEGEYFGNNKAHTTNRW